MRQRTLCHGTIYLFLQLVPTADPAPTHIPENIPEALVLKTPEWWSTAWTIALHSILHRD